MGVKVAERGRRCQSVVGCGSPEANPCLGGTDENIQRSEDRESRIEKGHPRSSILGYLVLRQLDAIAVRIGDVDRVPRALAVHSRLLDLDTFGLQLFDQFLRIVWPLDVAGGMRHAGKLFFRTIEQA